MSEEFHKSVLLQQVIDALQIKPGEKYIDATLGGGGHSRGIIEKGGLVLGIDQDQDSLEYVGKNQEARIMNHELRLVHGNFKDILLLAKQNGFEKVQGILFDLGVSSYQLDTAMRGFSLKKEAKLDMRMDRTQELTAWDVVNKYSKDELIDIFQRYGEEESAEKVAQEIVEARKEKKIDTTGELVTIVSSVIKHQGRINSATKIFQGIRIEVNSELIHIREGLKGAVELLDTTGRLVVISFHSLEDRIVKQTFDNWENTQVGKIITKKPIIAHHDEARSNPRARSAKMRVFERR